MKEIHADNLALALLMAQKSAMGRRCSPAHLPAEVALVMLLVALAAQWCHLVLTPNLGGTSLLSETEVAEAAGDQATIDTWPYEHVFFTHRHHFQGGIALHCAHFLEAKSAGRKH